ncbi:pre-mRNA-splicing factor syf2 [Phytophthora boehmeriae]|uniref:Pre-mRNA-splicing factor SYF2 n=1 Tax=Phytophthora boehmeriae TaxID=109152 RepID=A0A8T1X2A5_9STRA|nr:pre-mRNA-splicing factor syf2 [Phytophthora boehmeriae]
MADAEQDDQLTSMTPAQKKLFELRMKMNAGRKANKQEVAAEHDRIKNNDKKARKEEQYKKREEKKAIAASGKAHLNETAEVAESKAKKAGKKEKRKAAFGWDVFNQDSLYKGYKKRLMHLPTAGENEKAGPVVVSGESALGDELAYGKGGNLDEENVERMAQELEERIKARKKFSRRRQHVEGEDVDYINGQNRIFNRKASQAFDKYTVEIRQNLERGTAL